MASVMGIANAERTMSILRTLAQFASRPENTDVIALCVAHILPLLRPAPC